MKHGEGAGDDQRAFHHVPSSAAVKEAAQILDNLEALQCGFGEADLDYAAVEDFTSVQDAHDASARHRVNGRGDDGPHQAQQGIALQNAVRIERAEVRGAAHVDAYIQRVRFAAVFFADHQKVGDARIGIETLQGAGGHARAVNQIHLH